MSVQLAGRMHAIAKLHEKAIRGYRTARAALDRHKEGIGTIVTEAVRTGESLAGGGAAAALDWYMGDKAEAIPEAMVGPVPVVPVAALALKGIAFAFGTSRFSSDLHAFANGMGGAAVYAGLMRVFRAHQASSTTKA